MEVLLRSVIRLELQVLAYLSPLFMRLRSAALKKDAQRSVSVVEWGLQCAWKRFNKACILRKEDHSIIYRMLNLLVKNPQKAFGIFLY